MKQEDKELLLKDLCARLPYGVKVEYGGCACEVLSIDVFNEELTIRIRPGYCPNVKLEDIKPYLFPIESMTEEQQIDLTKFVANGIHGPNILYDWYNRNHFDYRGHRGHRGLISTSLANDATGLNIY